VTVGKKRKKYYLEILASPAKILELIKEELIAIKEKYGDERKSKIVPSEDDGEVDLESLIVEENVVVTVTHGGYVKRLPLDTYKTQRRGGKGVTAAGMKEEDFVENLYVASTHDYLLFFTSRGRLYWLKSNEVPASERQSKGKAIVNMLDLRDETIANVLSVSDFRVGSIESKLDIIVAMEAARNINLADVSISSLDLNLLDIDDMATRLGVTDTKGKLRVDSKTFKQIQEMLNQPKGTDTTKPK